LCRAKKGLRDVQLEQLVLPLLITPIVFYPTWALWLSRQEISILFELLAFQNGFFW
jgi:hypothetical protein